MKRSNLLMVCLLLLTVTSQSQSRNENGNESSQSQEVNDWNKGIEIINAGIGGNTSDDLVARLEEDVLIKNPDLVILMVGTNDMVNSRKLVSYSSYKNNIINMVKQLKQESIDVVLLSPPPVDPDHLFTRHSKKAFSKRPPNEKLDSLRYILEEVSSSYKTGFVDVYAEFKKLGLPKHNQDQFIRNIKNSNSTDGVHLTPKGYSFIGSLLFEYLLKNKYLEKNQKIICFGDSITKGVYVEGSGTSSGETYPAVLLNLIKENNDIRN